MKHPQTGLLNKILITTLILLSILFIVSLFRNIAYPLLWNDEAETVMFAKRILEYGYPKVYNTKNMVYLFELPAGFGIEEKSNTYIGTVWGHYYFATIGAFLAEKVNDIYIKTALLRIPFAVIGLIGLMIIAFSVIDFFNSSLKSRLLFFNLFLLFELLSISLVLHLREVRYYSLVIFLSACIFYVYIKHRFLKKINPFIYALSLALLLILLFNTFPPACFIFMIIIAIYECLEFFKKKQINNFLAGLLPLFISIVFIIPLLIFFQTLNISGAFSKLFNITNNIQLAHILKAIHFFQKHEFLSVVLTVKMISLVLWFYFRKSKVLSRAIKGNTEKAIRQKIELSNFLSLFFIIFILVTTKMPLPAFYQRYVITLQPVLIIILLVDTFIIFWFLLCIQPTVLRRSITAIVLFFICTLIILNALNKFEDIKGHIYELTHRYQGPLDFVISYIKKEYKDTKDLIIATNYEECAYMYYLGSKVIIGYVGNNLEEDLKMKPDIIIFRKRWAYTNKSEIFNAFFQREKYKKISFPVFDYPVNNIPELGWPLPHLYKTRVAKNDKERLEIYVKQ